MALVHNAPYAYSPIGRAEADGTLHGNPYAYQPVGHRMAGGIVTDAAYNHVGRVDEQGVVYARDGRGVGHVDADGLVHRSAFGYDPIGRVEGEDPSVREDVELSGAALLLLLQDKSR